MGPRNRCQHRLSQPPRRLAELGGEVALIDAHIDRDDSSGAHPGGQLAEDVVIDQGDADVLVPPSFASAGIHFAQQVQCRAPRGRSRLFGS